MLRGVTNFEPDSVKTTLTLMPLALIRRTNSSALKAAIPPVTTRSMRLSSSIDIF